jgi:SAM-dependent methyltransferase
MMPILQRQQIYKMDHSAATESGGRRRAPRVIDTDWLVLRGMMSAITDALHNLGNAANRNVMDFGCGSQPYRQLIESTGFAYLGADLGADADVHIASSGHVSAKNSSADIISSFQVLEHVRDLDLYLAEAKRILRPDGRLILSTHGTWLYHPHPEDHRRWTRTGLIHDVETRGFHVETCVAIVGPLAWTTLIRLTSFAFAMRKIPVFGPFCAGALAIAMNMRALLEDRITPAWVRDDNACVYLITARPA